MNPELPVITTRELIPISDHAVCGESCLQQSEFSSIRVCGTVRHLSFRIDTNSLPCLGTLHEAFIEEHS